MNITEKLHELSAKIELARGDYAMPYMKDRGLVPPDSSKEGFNAAMRKNVKDHRSKYNSWMGDNLTVGQAGKQVQSYRDAAAKGIKSMRKDEMRAGLRNAASRAEIAEGRAMQKIINAAMAKR